jgi:hypothetical protein
LQAGEVVCIIAACLASNSSKTVSVVAVAQLVESRIVIPVVVGSSPIGHPIRFKQKAQSKRLGFLFSAIM